MAHSKTSEQISAANDEQPKAQNQWRKPLALPLSKKSLGKHGESERLKSGLENEQQPAAETSAKEVANDSNLERGLATKSGKAIAVRAEPQPQPPRSAVNQTAATILTAEPRRLSEAELVRLLKIEDQDDLYDLQEVLRGSSLALYCVLLLAAAGEGRCRIPSKRLMSRAGIQTLVTLHKQEDWLTKLALIKKNTAATNQHGSSYRVYPLDTLPLRPALLAQLESHLQKYRTNE